MIMMDFADDEIELFIIGLIVNMYIIRAYPKNYLFQAFFTIGSVWGGALVMESVRVNYVEEIFVLIMMIFAVMLNFTYLQQNLRDYRKRKREG